MYLQSAAADRATQMGTPSAPARCGTAVSEVITRSRVFMIAAVSNLLRSRRRLRPKAISPVECSYMTQSSQVPLVSFGMGAWRTGGRSPGGTLAVRDCMRFSQYHVDPVTQYTGSPDHGERTESTSAG